LEQVSQEPEYIKVPPPRLQPTLPSKVVFVDVETTGLTDSDRIVSFAAILLETQSLRAGKFTVSVINVVCDPGKKSHPRAKSVHGFSDWVLRHQDPFSKYAGEIESLLDEADLIVAHNANFDMNFINRELVAVGRRPPAKPIYCTMEGHRNLDRGGSASLTALASQIGLSRRGTNHGALEDAWLAMMIYLDQHECPFKFPLESLPSDILNLKACPPQPDGPLPRRKRKRTTASVESSSGRNVAALCIDL
jgi:DNA polymerase III subunit epsilon